MKRNIDRFTSLVLSILLLSSMFVLMPFSSSADGPVVEGDKERLKIEKNVFMEGEPIMVTAVGSGQDWVGVYLPDAGFSIRWYYIDKAMNTKAPGSGVATDMRKAYEVNSGYSDYKDLPAGEYVIRLLPNGTSAISKAVASATITVLPKEEPAPAGPLSVSYQIANEKDGFAKGKVTVTVPKDPAPKTDVILYWADAKGKLEGYTSLAKFKVKGETTVFEFPDGMLIPEGATRLLAYTSTARGDKFSETFAECALPLGAAFQNTEKPKFRFTVVSDTHLTTDKNHLHARQYTNMLEDVLKTTPDSKALFIVGDMVDSGNEIEYKHLQSLHSAVKNAPPYYLAVGNHDLFNGTMASKTALFLKYAKLPDGTHPTSSHYDFWMEGYHFIFLGNDQMVDNLKTTLNEETLKWLDETLSENYDPGRPAFIFLHQSLYNTVSGSLPGQMWNGVENEKGLRDVLKKYPEAIMFNGHSHWTLNSESCMFKSNGKLPNIFNTSSTAYLWTSYNKTKGEGLKGSEGYEISVYEDKILVRGRDFIRGEWMPSAQFCVEYEGTKPEPPAPPVTPDPDKETPKLPNSEDHHSQENKPEENKESNVAIIITVASVAVVLIAAVVTVVVLKRKKK